MKYIPRIQEGQCEGCMIFTGGVEEPWRELTEYRGRKLCGYCIKEWRRREERVGREITWEEFRTGMVKK